MYKITVPAIEFFVSGLLALAWFFAGKWFDCKERLDARSSVIYLVDHALAGELEENGIFEQVCEVLAGPGGYDLVWFGEPDSCGSIRVLFAAGMDSTVFSGLPFRWDDSPWGHLPPGTVIGSGETQAIRCEFKCTWGSVPSKALRLAGLKSCVTAPVDMSFPKRMVLTAHSSDPYAFCSAEKIAFTLMARRVGEAIQMVRSHRDFADVKSACDDALWDHQDGILLVREKKVIWANPSAINMLACPDPKMLLDTDLSGILVENDAPYELRHAFRGSGHEGLQSRWEATVYRLDKTTFPGEITVSWISSMEGRKKRIVPTQRGLLGMITLRDITNCSLVMNDLKRELHFSTRVQELSHNMVLELDLNGGIRQFNRQCEDITGWRSRDVIGKKMAELLIAEPFREAHNDMFRAVLLERALAPLESQILTVWNDERLISWKYASLRDISGNISSIIVTGIDVTDRRRLEKTIIEMQKMEAVGRLAGGIAHDFNNILTGILGSLDIALKIIPASCPAAERPVTDAVRVSERAVALIRQLLDFSRRSPQVRRPVNIGNVIHEVVALFSQTIDRRIEVRYFVEEGLPPAFADSNQIHQVLMNLCVNARDAILESLDMKDVDGSRPLAEYWIYIRAERVLVDDEYCRLVPYARKGQFIRLSIDDNGVGMDEALQRRVFEPFFTTKKMGRGTGLGLSTVYGIVKQHNGWINIDSHFGKGTTFSAYFPEAEEAVNKILPWEEVVHPADRKEVILFADDEELIRDLGRIVLESFGYTILMAYDGEDAVEVYTKNKDRIHLVVMDITMPRRSGYEAMREIRAINPNARFILSSGYIPVEDIGDAAFLPKPYRADGLVRMVRAVLDGKGST